MITLPYTTDYIGKMPADARQKLADALGKLSPGERVCLTVTLAPPFGETLPPSMKIGEIIAWYQAIPSDYNDLNTLGNYSRLLACFIADFSAEVGCLAKDRNSCEWQRKSETALKMRKAMNTAAEGAKTSAAAAKIEVEADGAIQALAGDESLAEAEYQAGRLLLDGAHRVHDTMRQQIAQLRAELENEQRGRGSQHS